MSSAILVINANPLLNVVHTGDFALGAINRVAAMAIHAEGKGVNVARVLTRLGHTVVLTGFAGGHSGAWLRELIRAEGIEDAFVDTIAPIRVGCMASSDRHEHPTTLLPNGFPVTAAECTALSARVGALLGQVRLVIISGSVPDPAANRLYAGLLALCHAAAVPCWLDAHSQALALALASPCPPALAKPNLEEYAQSRDWQRVEELHITDGGGPVAVRLGSAARWTVIPPAIQQVNPIGSGDCYVAGLTHGWLLGWPVEERLRFAAAAGAANARRQDVAQITPAEIDVLLGDVTVEPAGSRTKAEGLDAPGPL